MAWRRLPLLPAVRLPRRRRWPSRRTNRTSGLAIWPRRSTATSTAEGQNCVPSRIVRLYRVKNNEDKLLGQDQTNATGEWAILEPGEFTLKSGLYYAKVHASLAAERRPLQAGQVAKDLRRLAAQSSSGPTRSVGRELGHRHHRQLRVDGDGGREHAGVADVDAGSVRHAEVGVDDAARAVAADRVAALRMRGVELDVRVVGDLGVELVQRLRGSSRAGSGRWAASRGSLPRPGRSGRRASAPPPGA